MGNKMFLQKSTSNKYSNFIVKHNQSCSNKLTDTYYLDQKRVVFISLNGLYETFDKCPSIVLYSAICLMPLKRKWIYKPKKYINEMKQRDEAFNLFHNQN
eukprot:841572_1